MSEEIIPVHFLKSTSLEFSRECFLLRCHSTGPGTYSEDDRLGKGFAQMCLTYILLMICSPAVGNILALRSWLETTLNQAVVTL